MNLIVDALMAQGFSEMKACRYACLIGDTPEIESDGRYVIRDELGAIIDRIQLSLHEAPSLPCSCASPTMTFPRP